MIKTRKKSGELVTFDENKFKRSLLRAGASAYDQEAILKQVMDQSFEGITTHRVYQMAYSLLRKRSHKIAGRYRLKKAILDMGPTGYPFELLVCELLKNQGYKVETGVIVKGHCISHEVDVVAEKDNRKIIIECKFHIDAGRKSDVKVPLYIHSRFMDIRKKWEDDLKNNPEYAGGWIVTNTRFSEDAMDFGKCAGLKLVSWDYPKHGSLRERIDFSGLHPLTALHNLTKKDKQTLMEKKVVLCKDIIDNPFLLEDIGIPRNKITRIIEEAKGLVSLSEFD